MIYQICDTTMSIITWDRLHFWIYLLNHNSWSRQTWLINICKQGQQLSVIFWTTWRTGARFQVLLIFAACPNYTITIYVKIPVFLFFWKGGKGAIKNGKSQPLKISTSCYIVILIKSYKSLKLVSSLQHSEKRQVKNVCHTVH